MVYSGHFQSGSKQLPFCLNCTWLLNTKTLKISLHMWCCSLAATVFSTFCTGSTTGNTSQWHPSWPASSKQSYMQISFTTLCAATRIRGLYFSPFDLCIFMQSPSLFCLRFWYFLVSCTCWDEFWFLLASYIGQTLCLVTLSSFFLVAFSLPFWEPSFWVWFIALDEFFHILG